MCRKCCLTHLTILEGAGWGWGWERKVSVLYTKNSYQTVFIEKFLQTRGNHLCFVRIASWIFWMGMQPLVNSLMLHSIIEILRLSVQLLQHYNSNTHDDESRLKRQCNGSTTRCSHYLSGKYRRWLGSKMLLRHLERYDTQHLDELAQILILRLIICPLVSAPNCSFTDHCVYLGIKYKSTLITPYSGILILMLHILVEYLSYLILFT